MKKHALFALIFLFVNVSYGTSQQITSEDCQLLKVPTKHGTDTPQWRFYPDDSGSCALGCQQNNSKYLCCFTISVTSPGQYQGSVEEYLTIKPPFNTLKYNIEYTKKTDLITSVNSGELLTHYNNCMDDN